MPDPVELLVIENVRAIDPASGLDETADVVIERGTITRVGRGAGAEPKTAERALVVDGSGRWLLPGFVDLHVHLREPGHEYKEDVTTGLAAAAAGGYAHVCAMPNTNPVNDTRSVTELMLRRASESRGAVLHPIGAITVGQKGGDLTEMAELREAGCVAVSDDGHCVMNSAVMRRALEYAKNFDMPVIQHCEDHDLTVGADMNEGATSTRLGLQGWPSVAEDLIVARDVLLAEYTGARYHVAHVSTLGAVRILREAKNRGLPVTAEVTPHHLLLTDAAIVGYDTFCKVNPPLREEADMQAVCEALADGTIDAIATDHAPHSRLEKDCEFHEASPGLMGLELCFGLLLDRTRRSALSLERLVDAMSTKPAGIAGIDRPAIAVDRRAAVTLVEPEAKWTPDKTPLHTKSTNTPFMSRELTGRVGLTVADGAVVFDRLTGSEA